MPIEGKFYPLGELVTLLGKTKQQISFKFAGCALHPGLYPAEAVEPHLEAKNINPASLPVRTHDHPAGATWAELEAEHDAAQAAGVAFRNADNI